MWGSNNAETFGPKKITSKSIPKTSIMPLTGLSTIKLDFSSETDQKRNKRRSSFLPASISDDHHATTSHTVGENSAFVRESSDNISEISSRPKVLAIYKKFCTGSKYFGEFNQLGMTGKGVYKFPHGVIYDGYFNKKGEFHGSGSLIYPNGQRVDGIWKNGKLVTGASCISNDNSAFGSQYCKMPDRRFQIEVQNDILPAGQEYLTNAPTPREIPPGMYDTGDGFYDPRHHLIIDYMDPKKTKNVIDMYDEEKNYMYKMLNETNQSQEDLLQKIRKKPVPRTSVIQSVPAEQMENWMVQNCRKGWDEPTGYRKDFYEVWTAGKKGDACQSTPDLFRSSTDEELIHNVSRMNSPTNVKTSCFYSFIKNPTQLAQKYVQDSRKGSLYELSNMLNNIFDPQRRPHARKTYKNRVFFQQKKLVKRSQSESPNYKLKDTHVTSSWKKKFDAKS